MGILFLTIVGIITTVNCGIVLAYMLCYAAGKHKGREEGRNEQKRN